MAGQLAQVKSGKIKKPHLILVYGPSGVGKSTFGAQAPAPIFIGAEEGTNNLDVARFPAPKSWLDITGAIDELANDKHAYKTLVIDSLDWAEPVLHQMICERHGVKSIELAAGGYGKGYVEAVNEWIKLSKSLGNLRDKAGMNIVLIAHNEVVKFNDPQTQTEYDRYQLKLYKKSADKIREFVDSILFCNFQIFSKKEGLKSTHYGDGARVLFTERRPGFEAKNRFGLPSSLPLSWDDYAKAVENSAGMDPAKIRAEINEMLSDVTDQVLKSAVIKATEEAKASVETLEAIKNRLIIRIGEAK